MVCIRLGRGFAHLADSLAHKQEIFGIDVASLDEAAGLLGASARIRRIHQPALVVHEVAQVATSASQPLAKVLGVISDTSAATVSLTPKMAPRM